MVIGQITIPNQAAGEYGYKFIVDGSDWKADPLNSEMVAGSDNSKLTITGTESGISPVVNGTSVTFVYPEDPKTSDKVTLAGDLTTPRMGRQSRRTYLR